MHTDYRDIILEVYEIRRSRNSSYSLRAFARDLGLNPTRVSDILNRRQGLSREVAETICEKMGLNEQVKQLFLNLVDANHARSRAAREQAQKKLEKKSKQTEMKVALESFKIVSDWQHFAILTLVKNKPGIKAAEIARRLEIPQEQMSDYLERLERVQLVEKTGTGFSAGNDLVATPTDMTSLAIQKYHTQILSKAQQSLEQQAVDQRDFSAMNMMISADQLPEIKGKIKEFRRGLLDWVEEAPARDRLYNLSIQFFSLEK